MSMHQEGEDAQEFFGILEAALQEYGMTPLIARAIRFFLRNPYESLVIVDKEGHFEYMDKGSEKFFGLERGGAKKLRAKDLIEMSTLPLVLESRQAMIGRVFDVNGQRRIGSAYPILKEGELVGAMGRLIFRSLDEVDRINEEVHRLKSTVKSLRQRELMDRRAYYTFDDILGESRNIRECVELAKKAAMTGTDVLIVGESGTGKELFAQAIHTYRKQDRPFVGVNTPAIPLELAESELFGYKGGAFSGASSPGKAGRFELADGGTLFLDEIATLPLAIQPKLLRALEEREVQVLGDTRLKKVDFQLVCATNIDLRKLADDAKFRHDLYYRIAKVTIRIAPLRERREDIPILAGHILKTINKRFGTRFRGLSDKALACLRDAHWLGNVRELANVLEQACLKKWRGEEITLDCLPAELTKAQSAPREPSLGSFKEATRSTERELILQALQRTGGNRHRAASLLGMPRSTFYKKLNDFDLNRRPAIQDE